MKLQKLLFNLIAIAGLFFLWSCNNDSDDLHNYGAIEDFFTIEDATLTDGEYETLNNTSRILNVSANGTFLQGGLVPLHIETVEPISHFTIGMRHANGFYNQNANAVAINDSNEYLIYLHINQGVTIEEIVVLLTEYTSDHVGGRTHELRLTNHGNVGGVLQVSMTWDRLNDLDLHVAQPNGETVFYGNAESSNGAFLDVDSNAACNIDNINNENITYGDDAIIYNGEYIVYVDMYSDCGVPDLTNFGVTTTYHGNPIGVSEGANPIYGSLEHDASMVEVMRFTITDGTELEPRRNTTHKIKNLSPHKN